MKAMRSFETPLTTVPTTHRIMCYVLDSFNILTRSLLVYVSLTVTEMFLTSVHILYKEI